MAQTALISLFLFVGVAPYSGFESLILWHNFDQSVKRPLSVAFYEIVGGDFSAYPLDRGRYWQWQLNSTDFAGSFHFVSNYPTTIEGSEAIVPPNITDKDKRLCKRTAESMVHFSKHYPNAKWYMRIIEDTMVNINGLINEMDRLEAIGDPMSTTLMSYCVHSNRGRLYIHGGSGWLISNFAMKQIIQNINRFNKACSKMPDDYAFTDLVKLLGNDPLKWSSERFFPSFPNSDGFSSGKLKWNSLELCPPNGSYLERKEFQLKIGLVSEAASIHMHRINLSDAWRQFSSVPTNVGVYWKRGEYTPRFCKLGKG